MTLIELLEECAEPMQGLPADYRKAAVAAVRRIRELAAEGNDGDYGAGVDDAILRINGGPVTIGVGK